MFYTFSGHPASCAVADKVLEIMEREDLVARSERMGALLMERLGPLAEHPNVAEIRGLGLMVGVEFVKDRSTMERFPKEARFAARLQGAGLRQGVFFYASGSGPAQDALLIGPPFTINGEDIDLMVDTLSSALEETLSEQ
jgi:adenosylmethionine-8-amino-7-oxononanoate aminotransferase